MSCSVSHAFAERSLNRAALCTASECSAKDEQCIRLINGTAAVEIRRCKLFLRKSFHAEHIAENFVKRMDRIRERSEDKTMNKWLDTQLSFFDDTQHAWVAEPGKFEAVIAASAADVKGTVPFELK